MQNKQRNRVRSFVLGSATALLIFASFFAKGSPKSETSNAVAADANTQSRFVVHEWGTFTSFSGSNGVQLDFRPLKDTDLPDFVFDRVMQSGESIFSKAHIRARIRMETPVTYFYTDRERTVHASVEFPKGLLTEFYPPVVSMGPEGDELAQPSRPFGKSKLDWGEITLIPATAFGPSVRDQKTKQWLQHVIEQRVLPTDLRPENHYYAARETDSAFVHVRIAPGEKNLLGPHGDYIEKFLFYRGVGKFEQPLQATIADDDSVTLINNSQNPIRSLFRLRVAGGSLFVTELDRLPSGQTKRLPGVEKCVTIEELRELMMQALEVEGLYHREALAMVNTWADSWFAEEGNRIFYLLPQELTDELIPLKISPKPDETIRILVGRIELMTPSSEAELMDVVSRRAMHRALLNHRRAEEQNPEPVILPIPKPIERLGRLAEPAMVRIRELAKDEAVAQEAAHLIAELQSDPNQNRSVVDIQE